MSATCPTCGRPRFTPRGLAQRARRLLETLDLLEKQRAALEELATAEETPRAEDAGPREPTKTEALAEWMRVQLAQAGPEGIPLGRLREDALRSGITKSPGRFYAAKRMLGATVEEVRADMDRGPIRLRLAPRTDHHDSGLSRVPPYGLPGPVEDGTDGPRTQAGAATEGGPPPIVS